MQSTQSFLETVAEFDSSMRHVVMPATDLTIERLDEMQVAEHGTKRLSNDCQQGLKRILKLPSDLLNRLQPDTQQSVLGDLFTEMQHREKKQLRISMTVDFRLPLVNSEPRVGDVVEAGFSITHCPTGSQPTAVSCSIYRLACENGVTVPICTEKGKALRIRLPDVKYYGDKEMAAQISQRIQLGRRGLKDKLKALRTLTNLQTDVEADLKQLVKQHRWNRQVRTQLIKVMKLDEAAPSQGTRYDIFLALSRVGTHGGEHISSRVLNQLLRIGGIYSQGDHVRSCPHCHSILAGDIPIASIN